MPTAIDKYLKQLDMAFANNSNVKPGDLAATGRRVYDEVGKYLSTRNLIKRGAYEYMSVSNEAMSLETAMNAQGVDGLKDLVLACGINPAYAKECCKSILNVMNRCAQGPAAAWQMQNMRADHTATGQAEARPLSSLYSSDIAGILNSTAVAGQEAFGTNVDMAVPDMKVAITVAIMDFHVRLIPRVMPTRSTTQPNVSYTKEWLEVYDLTGNTKDSQRLVDLYADPSFARNELKKIEINMANPDADKFAIDGILKFGPKANILELSTREDKYGYSHINRTDLIADNVQIKFVRVQLSVTGGSTELFDCEVPISKNRLTRMVNANDSAMRNADIKFRTYLRKGALTANGSMSGILSNLGDDEALVLDFNVKPTISLKWGIADCLADVSVSVRHDVDNAELSGFANSLMSVGTVSLIGYELDARFSEENLRKTSIAVMTHRVPFSFDIPIGRNYVFDYAIGQVNAEENATNLTKVIGLGQDKVALELGIRTIEDVYDRIRLANTANPVDRPEYVGTNYVAGDKVRPSIFIGDLDLTHLETLRDADRAGDIKQKAISMLTAATSRILQESFLQQQLGGSTTATFKGITSIEILGNVIGMPHIHDHMSKDDARNVGDGVEYVLVLPNGVKIEFVTSTFDSMRDKIVMWPTIPNNTESELHFAHNWDYGCMVAHYTPSGEAAHHRLFGNIRELPIVVNPLGLIIQVKGIDLANGIAIDGILRPTFEVNVEGAVTTTVNGTITTAPSTGEGGEGGTDEP